MKKATSCGGFQNQSLNLGCKKVSDVKNGLG